MSKFLQYHKKILINTHNERFINISKQVIDFCKESKISNGILNLSILHTSCSLIIQENVSNNVLIDIYNFFEKLIPKERGRYLHDCEGLDDMPAHLRTMLTNTNLSLSVINDKLCLGQWQGIFLLEHRTKKMPHREIIFHIFGN